MQARARRITQGHLDGVDEITRGAPPVQPALLELLL